MPKVTPPGFCDVIHSISLVGDPERQAITYGVETDADASSMSTRASGLHQAFVTHLIPQLANVYALEATEVQMGTADPVGSPGEIGVHTARVVGGNTAPTAPQNNAYLIHKRSGFAGRRHRGRLYFPGVYEGHVDHAGVIATPIVGALTDAFSAWLASFPAIIGVSGMVILHSTSLKSPTPNPTPVLNMTCDPVIATQRRRLR